MNALKGVFVALTLCLVMFNLQANGQVPPTASPCTATMLTSFNPCISYLTNGNGTSGSPTSNCCNSLRSLMTNGSDCLCQILTGGIPFRIPLNRTSAISLPKACNQPSIPIQCSKASGAPAPAPGPVAFSPSASPAAALSPSGGSVPVSTTPALGPVSDTTPSTPEATVPSTSTPTRGGPTSASPLSCSLSALLLILPVAVIMSNFF